MTQSIRCEPRITVGHAGKQHAYRLASAVQRLGCLDRFVTSAYFKPRLFPDCLFALWPYLNERLRRRTLDALDESRVTRRWDLELPTFVCRSIPGTRKLVRRLGHRHDFHFDCWAARKWASQSQIYWGFQGSCLESLRAARLAGAISVAEFAANHITLVKRTLALEAERHPEWADTIGALEMPTWYQHRLEREPHEADYCIVASGFTKKSLMEVGVSESKIKLLPLGADLEQFREAPRSPTGKFRILFVGKIGQQKGIKYLLQAYKEICSEKLELVLVGPVLGSGRALAEYSHLVTCLGPLSQENVVREMRRSNVLVLPSVLEGFGLVIAEAMATGMPVIGSTHSAGPEIIENGVDGFVIEPEDVSGIAGRIDWLATHRDQCCEMGRAAAQKAHKFSWEAHELRLSEIIDEIWKDRPKDF